MTILTSKTYKEEILGISFFSNNLVTVIGEQVAELEDGRVVEQYI